MISEELQAGIDIIRELIDNASSTDIASISVKFIRELLEAVDTTQAKLDAVPVEAIRTVSNIIDVCGLFDDTGLDESESLAAIAQWLETQVQP